MAQTGGQLNSVRAWRALRRTLDGMSKGKETVWNGRKSMVFACSKANYTGEKGRLSSPTWRTKLDLSDCDSDIIQEHPNSYFAVKPFIAPTISSR